MRNGYWQDKKYFTDKLDIKFKQMELSNKNLTTLECIKASESVCIHVRRGDYLLPQNQVLFGGVCTHEYYSKALKVIGENVKNPSFYIFSDDISWCRENLNVNDAIYVDWNKGNDSVFDMYLMSYCKYFILANSTFSYWAAKISHSDQVIYPKKWFANIQARDIFPEKWLGI